MHRPDIIYTISATCGKLSDKSAWVATCKALPNLKGHGSTPQAAIENAEEQLHRIFPNAASIEKNTIRVTAEFKVFARPEYQSALIDTFPCVSEPEEKTVDIRQCDCMTCEHLQAWSNKKGKGYYKCSETHEKNPAVFGCGHYTEDTYPTIDCVFCAHNISDTLGESECDVFFEKNPSKMPNCIYYKFDETKVEAGCTPKPELPAWRRQELAEIEMIEHEQTELRIDGCNICEGGQNGYRSCTKAEPNGKPCSRYIKTKWSCEHCVTCDFFDENDHYCNHRHNNLSRTITPLDELIACPGYSHNPSHPDYKNKDETAHDMTEKSSQDAPETTKTAETTQDNVSEAYEPVRDWVVAGCDICSNKRFGNCEGQNPPTACVNYECMDCAGDVCLNCQHLSEDKKHCTEHSTTIPVDAEDEYCCLDFIHKTDNEEEPEPRKGPFDYAIEPMHEIPVDGCDICVRYENWMYTGKEGCKKKTKTGKPCKKYLAPLWVHETCATCSLKLNDGCIRGEKLFPVSADKMPACSNYAQKVCADCENRDTCKSFNELDFENRENCGNCNMSSFICGECKHAHDWNLDDGAHLSSIRGNCEHTECCTIFSNHACSAFDPIEDIPGKCMGCINCVPNDDVRTGYLCRWNCNLAIDPREFPACDECVKASMVLKAPEKETPKITFCRDCARYGVNDNGESYCRRADKELEPRIISAYDETCEEFIDINGGNE